MARVIQTSGGRDVLEVVKWNEIFVIYVQSVMFNFFIVCKNALLFIKRHLEKRFAPERQKIVDKFPALSLIGGGVTKVCSDQQSIACPHQLMDSQLGQHKYIKLKTTKLHYIEKGYDDDRVVLLLHGFPDCYFGWRYQIPMLSRANRVIALDLKGFGDSDKPAFRHYYRPSVICSELKEFLDALNIKTVTIIGHDLGGLVGWIFALKHPDYVKKFIAISAPQPNHYWQQSWSSLTPNNWRKMVQMPFLPENELNNSCKFFDKFYLHLRSDNAAMVLDNGDKCEGQELIETYKYIFNNPLDWTGPLNYFRNYIFYRVKSNMNVRCPCIIIAGNEDPNYKLETFIRSAEFCENSLIRIVEGAGHFPHQSHHREVNQILLKILGGPKRRPEIEDEALTNQRGIVSRMINKMYGVGQQYGNFGVVNGKIFSGLTD